MIDGPTEQRRASSRNQEDGGVIQGRSDEHSRAAEENGSRSISSEGRVTTPTTLEEILEAKEGPKNENDAITLLKFLLESGLTSELVSDKKLAEEKAADILCCFPQIACSRSWNGPNKYHPDYPLLYFLLAGCHSDTVRKVYLLNPWAMRSSFYYKDNEHARQWEWPFHAACRLCSDQVIQFLAKETPLEVLTRRDCEGKKPLYQALRYQGRGENCLSSDTFGLLANMEKSAILRCHLEVALYYGCSSAVTQCLVEAIPKYCDELSIDLEERQNHEGHGIEGGGGYLFDISLAKTFSSLIPRLRILNLLSLKWTIDGFIFFIKTMHGNDSHAIEELGLSIPSPYVSNNAEACLVLQEFCETNLTVRIFDLNLRRGVQDRAIIMQKDDSALLHALTSGLQNNQSLEELYLSGIHLSRIDALDYFLSNGVATRRVFFSGMKIWGSPTTNQPTRPTFHSTSLTKTGVKQLSFQDYQMPNDCLLHLMVQMQTLPLLDSLFLEPSQNVSPRRDLTFPIISLLHQAPNLRELSLKGHCLNHADICKALQLNRTVESFTIGPTDITEEDTLLYLDLVQFHNTTITKLYPMEIHRPRIQYYLALNRYGRGKARYSSSDGTLCLSDFVGLLSDAPASHVSIRFDLLREAPCLWTSSCTGGNLQLLNEDSIIAVRKKRKCPP
jgi:hypothetical protein